MRLYELHGPGFAAWFAGSKVVDERGHPKRMFHGTRFDVRSFDPERANPTALYGPGFYFTDSPDVAGGVGTGHPKPHPEWDDVDAKATFNQAGYAFQAPRFSIAPLTKKQMAHAKRLFMSKQVQHDAYEDVGTRRMYHGGWKAFQRGPEAFAHWLANEGPRWFVERIKAQRERITSPNVMPVYLSIKNPFEMEEKVLIDTSIPPWSTEFPADHPMKRLYDAAGNDAVVGFVSACRAALDLLRTSSHLSGKALYDWLSREVLGGDLAKANAVLRRLGYDGIHHKGGQVVGTMGDHDVWIAFYPSQIKSVFNPNPTDSPNVDEAAE